LPVPVPEQATKALHSFKRDLNLTLTFSGGGYIG